MKVPPAIQDLMARMMADINRAEQKRAVEDAKRDPEKYKLSRTMNENSNYCYYNGGWIWATKTRLEHHTFCRSNHTNIGNMFLFWHEVASYTPGGKWKKTERVEWGYSDSKKDAKTTIIKRRDSWRAKHPQHDQYKPVRCRS